MLTRLSLPQPLKRTALLAHQGNWRRGMAVIRSKRTFKV
jgi:hypothetical protein